MSLKVGELFATMGLETKDFDQKLDESKSKGDQAASSISGSFSKMGGFVKNALATAAGFVIHDLLGAVAGKVKDLAGAMIGGNAQFEDYGARFTVLLKDAGLAKDRLADLAEFGAKTPFELPQVVDADIVLQGFGLHSEEAAKKFGFAGSDIRTIAGDVASGTGTDFKEMALLIGKFSAGATGEAISRFQELGITSRDELTKLGLEFSKSGELLSPLPESMNVILKLMKDKYGGLMDVQSGTFNGMVSNLQDWVAGTLRTIGQPIFEVLKAKLGDLLAFLNDPATTATLNNIATWLSGAIASAIDWLSNTAIPALKQAWVDLQPAIQTVMAVLQTLPGIFTQVWQGIQPVIGFIQENLQPILAGLAAILLVVVVPAFFAWAAAATASAVATIAALAPVLIPLAAIGLAVGLLYKVWTEDWGGIRTTLTNFWNQYGKPIFDQLKTWLAETLTQAIATLTRFWNETLWPAVKAIAQWFQGTLFPILSVLLQWLARELTQAIRTLADFWTNTLWPALKTVWNFINGSVIPILRILAEVYIAAVSAAVRVVAGLWTNLLWPALQKVWQFVSANVIPILKILVDVHLAALKLATEKVSQLWNDTLKPALDAVWAFIKDNIVPIFQALVDKLSGPVGQALETAKGALDGVKDSFGHIDDAISYVIDKLQEFKDWLDNIEIPDWLQGHSPPPLAHWLDYIGASAEQVTQALSPMMKTLGSLPDLPGLNVGGASGGGSTSQSNTTNNSITLNQYYPAGASGRRLADEVNAAQRLGVRL